MTQLYATVINAILSSVSVLTIEIDKNGLHLLFEEFLFKDERKKWTMVCVCVLLPGRGVQGEQPRKCFL